MPRIKSKIELFLFCVLSQFKFYSCHVSSNIKRQILSGRGHKFSEFACCVRTIRLSVDHTLLAGYFLDITPNHMLVHK